MEHGISWLQNLREIVIDPVACPNVAREFSGYELERTADGSAFKSGFPDKNNHTIDAVRYACERDMQRKKVVLPPSQKNDHSSYWTH